MHMDASRTGGEAEKKTTTTNTYYSMKEGRIKHACARRDHRSAQIDRHGRTHWYYTTGRKVQWKQSPPMFDDTSLPLS